VADMNESQLPQTNDFLPRATMAINKAISTID
jgi:hypothetical protein